MTKLFPFTVTSIAGQPLTVPAEDAVDALLRRCKALYEAAELAARQGLRRRLDPGALPASVEEGEATVAAVDDLYPAAT